MSKLNYKELQEKGVFNVPYKAFQFMQHQQSKIDELEKQLDMMKYINDEQGKNIQNAFKTIEIEQGFKDELQKRVDEALEDLEYPTAPWDETIASVIGVLRGDSD